MSHVVNLLHLKSHDDVSLGELLLVLVNCSGDSESLLIIQKVLLLLHQLHLLLLLHLLKQVRSLFFTLSSDSIFFLVILSLESITA